MSNKKLKKVYPEHSRRVFVGMSPNKSLRDLTGQAGSVTSHKKGLVFVGMSGGVDSSVAAYLLKKDGYDVVGVFIRSYNLDGCADQDSEDARRVAEHLKIPFYVWDFEEEYKRKVVDYMIDGYKRGETPNPDVMCNKEIKFGLFFARAIKLGADYVATGHYVKKIGNSLYAAKDKNKDQSYFLWALGQEQIKRSLFPIGDYLKPKLRVLAKRAGLPTAEKKDSQGICFLGQVSIKDFLKTYLPEKKGMVLNASGKKIGEHSGAHLYTIGQRHIGVNFQFPISNLPKDRKPLYVASKDVKKNTVTVAEGGDNQLLYQKEIELRDINFLSGQPKSKNISVLARVRYRQPVSPAVLSRTGKVWKLTFKTPQKFVAPGQSAVFYLKSGQMLGGGVIV